MWVKNIYCLLFISKSCLILCDPMDCSTPGFPGLHYLLEFTQIHAIGLVMLSNYLILCHPLLLPSVFPSSRIFSNELTVHIRWTKYWSFSFSISPSTEDSGLISFRIAFLGLIGLISLQSIGLSRVFSSTTIQKHQFFGNQLLYNPTLTSIHDY